MQGLNPSSPLTVDHILRHAAAAHGQVEVATAAVEGAPRRISYAQLESRVRRLAGALAEGGVGKGDSVALIGSSTGRQLEAWFAIMMAGAACHLIDPQLSPEKIAALLRANGDVAVFVDPELLTALEPALLKLPQLERVVAMGEAGQILQTRMNVVVSQDALMETAARPLRGPLAEEDAPGLLLHGAGAGASVSWSQRSCVLQALAAQGPGGIGLTPDDAVLLLAPSGRAAAATLLLATPLAGAKLVLPGPRTEIQQVRVLADREGATVVVASPSQLQALHEQFRAESRRPSALKRAIAIGSPCPAGLVRAWRDSFGVEVWSAWGSVEVAGVAAVGRGASGLLPLFGIELELLDADGRSRPHDGVAIGRLWAGGPLVSGAGSAMRLDTGDLATIDARGRVALLGRADEQVIAAGAQIPGWPIEAAALEHPATARAAAIDAPKGMDVGGPLLVVERQPGALASKADYLRFLGERLGGLKLGELLFVNGFPLDGAGRIDKPLLRHRLEQLLSPKPPPPAPAQPASAPVEPIQAPPEPFAAPPAPPVEVPTLTAALAMAAAPVLFKEEPPPADPVPAPDGVLPEPEPPAPALSPEPAPAAVEDPEPVAATEPEPEPEPESELEPEPEPAPEPEYETQAPPAAEGAAVPELAAEAFSLGPLGDATARADPADGGERSLFLRLDSHPHQDRRKAEQRVGRTEIFLNLAALLALSPVLMIVAGALGVRFDLIDWRVGVGQLILDWPSKLALIATLGGVFAIFAAVTAGFRRYGPKAAFALVLPLATLGAVIWLKSAAESYPPVHDVATDWSQPITFSDALLRERGQGAYPVEGDPIVPASAGAYMNRRVAEVNGETCPGARSVNVTLPPDQAYARAKSALTAEGLALFSERPAAGRLEATATNLWLGLKDDVAVRITPVGQDTQIDVRSVSRGGVSDYGANCRRVTEVMRLISGLPRNS